MKTKEATHTPGPWITLPDTWVDYNSPPGPGEYHQYQVSIRTDPDDRYEWGSVAHTEGGNLEITQANARLIAAAPEMLAALEQVDAYMTEQMEHDQPFAGIKWELFGSAVDAAIAKATGQEEE